ncbi:MAG: class I SAM-dependent methyltransferase [Fidelibacterota bacterium]|nr:MAG: class I SAM-dependent methyltransferase [Candidatus Neomarinimicrobiota bacterium]
MDSYYAERLSAERLRLCYELAPPRVKQYLEAEIAFVLERIQPSDGVLELGCGYGRVLERLTAKADQVVGIDTSVESIALARQQLGHSCLLSVMDAVALGFSTGRFDVVLCIQNGISVFRADQRKLISEAVRVARSGGRVLFSSYADSFWKDRLRWFRIQAEHGLVGEIDEDATGGGIIVCKDGFRASTVNCKEFTGMVRDFGLSAKVSVVDDSSIFCDIQV